MNDLLYIIYMDFRNKSKPFILFPCFLLEAFEHTSDGDIYSEKRKQQCHLSSVPDGEVVQAFLIRFSVMGQKSVQSY